MVSAISSINQYPVSTESLEIIRRLQSLGVAPTGNLSIDKQRLQTAELQKKQQTLASNSSQNLNRFEGTGNDFSSTLNNINGSQLSSKSIGGTQETQSIGLINGANTVSNSSSVAQISSVKNDNGMVQADKMVGATQLAELNKLKLGLIA